jgi:hypothetical protein
VPIEKPPAITAPTTKTPRIGGVIRGAGGVGAIAVVGIIGDLYAIADDMDWCSEFMSRIVAPFDAMKWKFRELLASYKALSDRLNAVIASCKGKASREQAQLLADSRQYLDNAIEEATRQASEANERHAYWARADCKTFAMLSSGLRDVDAGSIGDPPAARRGIKKQPTLREAVSDAVQSDIGRLDSYYDAATAKLASWESFVGQQEQLDCALIGPRLPPPGPEAVALPLGPGGLSSHPGPPAPWPTRPTSPRIPPSCPAGYHLDGDGECVSDKHGVGPSLDDMRNALGSFYGDANYNPACDFDGDGDVDFTDLAEFRRRYAGNL